MIEKAQKEATYDCVAASFCECFQLYRTVVIAAAVWFDRQPSH